jgi:alcohol dehydrogenase
MNKVKNPGIPVICYPTTAGTGSEITHTASFIDTNSNTKLGIKGRHVAPIFGVLHPELTFSCPPKTTIFSGLDAMVHSLEAVSAKTANDLSITLGAKGFSLLFRYFEDVLKEPKSYFAREQMLLGSYYAGLAMMNVGGGPASGISYPLGVHFKVPHGIAGGIFLPHVIKFNTEHGYDGYEAIYNLLPQANLSLSARDKARDFSEKFSQFYGRLQAPMVLDAYGIAKKDIPLLTKLTMEQRSANLTLNPTPFTEKDVVQILEKVIS